MSVKVDNTITALKPRMEMPNGCGFTLVEYDPPVRLISRSIEEDEGEVGGSLLGSGHVAPLTLPWDVHSQHRHTLLKE